MATTLRRWYAAWLWPYLWLLEVRYSLGTHKFLVVLQLCSLYLPVISIRSLSRTALSCACTPLVSRVCCGNACPLSTGRSQRSVSRCGFVRRSQCRSCRLVHAFFLVVILDNAGRGRHRVPDLRGSVGTFQRLIPTLFPRQRHRQPHRS